MFQEELYETVARITNRGKVQTFKLRLISVNRIELHLLVFTDEGNMNELFRLRVGQVSEQKEYLTHFFNRCFKFDWALVLRMTEWHWEENFIVLNILS